MTPRTLSLATARRNYHLQNGCGGWRVVGEQRVGTCDLFLILSAVVLDTSGAQERGPGWRCKLGRHQPAVDFKALRLDEFTQGLERTGRQDAKQPAKETEQPVRSETQESMVS